MDQNAINAIIEAVKEFADAETLNDGDGLTEPLLYAVPESKRVVDLSEYFEKFREFPARRKGTAKLTTLEAFIAHANRFKDNNSAIFADQNQALPKLVSVIDYHTVGPSVSSKPRFGQHRGEYAFPVSDEWRAWTSFNRYVQQAEFAAFIEDHIADVADPSGAGESVKEFASLLGTTLASPARLMELSRGLTVNVSGKVTNAVNLSTGEAQLTFSEEHKDSTGAKLTIPGAFILAIPVFRGGALYQVPARTPLSRKGRRCDLVGSALSNRQGFPACIRRGSDEGRDRNGFARFLRPPRVNPRSEAPEQLRGLARSRT